MSESAASNLMHNQADAQLAALRSLLDLLGTSNLFYQQKLRDRTAANDSATFPESIEAFTRAVPFTTKQELSDDQASHPPYGSNLTFPLDCYTRIHQTSSTTGSPLRWLDTPESWAWLLGGWECVYEAAGVTSADRIFAAFSFGPFIGFWMAFEAALRMGCLCLPGGAMNSATRIRAIVANRATVLLATPTYAMRLGEVAAEERIDLLQSDVRTIIVAGEPGGSVPAVRERIESLWPTAQVFDHHGMTEVGPVTFECPATPGRLHINHHMYLAEVIDQQTLQPVEVDDDAIGELVLTTLGRRGSPLLRYRTGDLVKPINLLPCECGRFGLALEGGIIARADDMVFIRGVNLYPSAVDALVRRVEGIAEYECRIFERDALTELEVTIEPDGDVDNPQSLADRLQEIFRDACNLRVPVRLAEANTLPRYELKSRRWKRESGVGR